MAFHCRCEHLESECNYPACFNGEKDKKAEVGVEARQACDPTLTQCPRCNNDIRKCDGVFVAPQPPAPCQSSTDTEYYRAECEKPQSKVAILDGLSQVAIDGGWTYRGMEAYAKGLEAKVAEQAATIEQLGEAMTSQHDSGEQLATSVMEQAALIEQLGKGLSAVESLIDESTGVTGMHRNGDIALWKSVRMGGFFESWLVEFDEALAAIAAHRGQYSELAAQCPESRPQCSELEKDAARYRWLRSRDLDSIVDGGVFAGMVPDNVVLNGGDLDAAIDAAIAKDAP